MDGSLQQTMTKDAVKIYSALLCSSVLCEMQFNCATQTKVSNFVSNRFISWKKNENQEVRRIQNTAHVLLTKTSNSADN